MAWAVAHRGTPGTPDHHYPEVARCQKRRPFVYHVLRISEYRLTAAAFSSATKRSPEGSKAIPRGSGEVSRKRALSSVRCKYQDRLTTRAAFISLNKRHIAFHLGRLA